MTTIIDWDFNNSAKAIASSLKHLPRKSHETQKKESPVCSRRILTPQESSPSNLVELSQWDLECRHRDGNAYLSHPPVLIPHFPRQTESGPDGGIESVANAECSLLENAAEFDIEVIDEGAEESWQILNSSIIDNDYRKSDIRNKNFDPSCNNQAEGTSTAMQHTEWTFSIVFHDVWRVPTLYFQCIHVDGTVLSRNEVLEILLQKTSKSNGYHGIMTLSEEELWDFVSREEHPITGIPSFFLHPCQTTSRMELLLDPPRCRKDSSIDDRDTMQRCPLLSWMSMILPSVGCKISPDLFCCIQDTMTRSGSK